jgi:hypothetical protein
MLFQIIAGIFIPNDIFKTNSANASWFDSGYGYRKAITIDHNKVSHAIDTGETNFPVLVSFTDPLLKTTGSGGRVTSTNGYDIIFSNAAGSQQLKHEIEKYTPTTGELEMWVKIPTLSSSTDTIIYMYYGNSGVTTSQESKTEVWDDGGGNHFKGVWHMKETGTNPVANDSTSNTNNSTAQVWTPTTSGQIDGAGSFDGSTTYVNVGKKSSLDINNAVTLSAWVNAVAFTSSTYESIIRKINASDTSQGTAYGLTMDWSTSHLKFFASTSDGYGKNFISSTALVTGSWYYVTATYDSATHTAYIYVNGVLDATSTAITGSILTSTDDAYIGYTGARFNGTIDEVRLSDTARSADWIATEYNNESNPTEFYSLGIEEVQSPVALSTFGYRKAITIDHNKVSHTVDTGETNFPVLINLPTDTNLATHAQDATHGNGGDILFTSASTAWNTGTVNDKLAHEIETYTPATGSLQAWVKIPNLSSTVDTVIYMYYGNASIASQQNKNAVWDNNTKSVYHLDETGTGAAGDYKDSAINHNDSANTGATQPTVTTSGQIGNAETFDGASSKISIPINSYGPRTVEGWFKITTDATTRNISQSLCNAFYQHKANNYIYLTNGSEYFTVTPAIGVWNHIVLAYPINQPTALLYVNGVKYTPSSTNSNSVEPISQIGTSSIATYFLGPIDEFRVSDTVRSADWIKTEYNNQSNPTEFYSLGIEEVQSPVTLSTFGYRKAITIDHNKVSHAVDNGETNFPVLINLPTDANLAAHAQADNDDILFTSSSVAWSSGTVNDKLAHEIETYTAANGSLQAWVKIPNLSSTQDTVIYMYYGNGSVASQQNKTAVWDTNTKMVQHLKETGTNPTVYDSTSNANNSTAQVWTPTTSGQIGNGGSFNGTIPNYVNVAGNNGLNITSDITIEALVKLPSTSTGTQIVLEHSVNPGLDGYNIFVASGALVGRMYPNAINSTKIVNDDVWHHIVMTNKSGANGWNLYVDGVNVKQQSGVSAVLSGSPNLQIGRRFDNTFPFTGSIDEVRLSDTARSADWIKTEYNNQSQPTEFYSLGIEEVQSPVALSTFGYRKAITIDHNKVSHAVDNGETNFPVLINLPTDANLAAHAQADNDDILFTSSSVAWNSGTVNDKLAHEIETYTASNGSLQAWVKIPNLSSTQDTVIYMYYGNGSIASQQNKTAVWDMNTKMVQHMNQTGTGAVGDYKDSTQYGNNSTNTGSTQPTVTALGKIGNAENFDGASNYVDVGSSSSININTSLTLEAWIYSSSITGEHSIIDKGYSTAYQLETDTSKAKEKFYIGGVLHETSSPSSSFNINSWYHVVSTVSDGSQAIYVNGILQSGSSSYAGSIGTNSISLRIGDRHDALYFSGSLDEVRISNVARSADWIKTEYNNQSNPTEFYSLGIEEVQAPASLSTFGYRKAITIDHTKVSHAVDTGETNFPVLINLPTDTNLAAHAQDATHGNGGDILFTSSSVAWNSGTVNDKLAHEIEIYTTATGSLQAWVKIPNLSSAQDTVIYMYYGNNTIASQQNKTAVWDTNTKMVQHMNQTGTGAVGDYKDSTTNANNSINNANEPAAISGQVDGAQAFNGSQYVRMNSSSSLNISSAQTVSVWFNTSITSNYNGFVSKYYAANGQRGYALEFNPFVPTNGGLRYIISPDGINSISLGVSGSLISPNVWHQATGVYDGSKMWLYVDGVSMSSTSYSGGIYQNSESLYIGKSVANGFFTGSLDETRISDTARSADWIATEYANQSNPLKTSGNTDGFVTLSPEQVYTLELTGSATQTSGTSQVLTFTAKDVSGGTMTTFSGDKTFRLSGALSSPDGQVPTCSDKSSTDIAFGSDTVLTFANGIAHCTLKLYKAESATITASSSDLTGANTNTLPITVSPDTLNNFLITLPPTASSGTAFGATITARDAHNNTTTSVSGTTNLTVNQSGTILPTSISSSDFTDDGVWTGNITISNIIENPSVTLTATDGAVSSINTISVLGVPQAPGSVSASRVSDNQFTVNWQDSSTIETGYKIERKTDSGSGFGSYTEIGTVGANTTSFTDNSTNDPSDPPSSDKRYQYRVRGYQTATGSGAYTEDPFIHYTTPDTPTNVFATHLSDTSFSVNFTDQANVENTHRIKRCSNANCDTANFETDLGTFESSPETDATNISGNSRYLWQVRAETPAPENLDSTYANSNYEFTKPSAPTIQAPIIALGGLINVNWQDNSAYEDGFRIEVSTDGGAYAEVTPSTNTVGANINSYAFSANPDHNYKFKVRAHIGATVNNSELFSDYSNESEAIYSIPPAPSNAVATFVSNTEIDLSWTDNSTYEDGFRIEVSTDGGAYTEITPSNNTVGSNITTYAFTSSSNHSYKFKVRAHIPPTPSNGQLLSDYSPESNLIYTSTTLPAMDTPVVNSPASITWHWFDTSNFEENFHLHFTLGKDTEINDIPANTTSYTTDSLDPNTRYAVHIHSYRSDTGESDPAYSAPIYTFANIPSALIPSKIAGYDIKTDWNANSNPAGTQYYVENIETGISSGWITDTAYTFHNLQCNHTYSFHVKARNGDNIETTYTDPSTIEAQACPSTLPPTASNPPQTPGKTTDNPEGGFKVSINDNNQYTNNPNVTLTLSAGDDTDKISVSNSPAFNNASLVPYQKEFKWNLDPTDGAHTVYVKFYTRYGIASKTFSDSIILDTIPPSLNITNLKSRYLTTDAIDIQGTTQPDTRIIYNLDSERVGIIPATNGKFTLSLGTLTAGTHSLQLAPQDMAGNSAETMQLFIQVEKETVKPPVPSTPNNPTAPTNPTNPSTPSNPTPTNPNPTPTPVTPTPATPSTPAIPTPSVPTPNQTTPLPLSGTITQSPVPAPTPATMQGEWNLLSLQPIPKQISKEDLNMIIEKFPELKKTFQNLGVNDFTDPDRLKNVSLNLPGISETMGISPLTLNATLPNPSTPITELDATLKKGIPENVVFVKTKDSSIDVSSALTFEDGNPSQKISLLSGKAFQLILRPDQPVTGIKGYITFKERDTALETKDTNILQKLSSILKPGHIDPAYADDQNIEEKLVLTEFDYNDDDHDGIWTADIQTPAPSGDYELINVLQYKDLKLGSKTIRMITVVDPEGYVYRVEGDGSETRIQNATVSLYWFNPDTNKYELWNAKNYQQSNPQITDKKGTYSFLVPPGTYYLQVKTSGYQDYQGKPFDVTAGSGVHTNIEVVAVRDWKSEITWERIIILIFGIAIFYNFYGDIKARRKRKATGV